jgi:uncharacterized membrane protein (UPF0127 family)
MRRLSLLVSGLILLGGCGSGPSAASGSPRAASPAPNTSGTIATPSPGAIFGAGTLTIQTGSGELVLFVEVASTEAAQHEGLMGRTELAPDTGMVFLFPDEQPRQFWMKDTLIPLSIAFYDAEGSVVSILDMEPCHEATCPLYDSGKPAMGAVEVEQGYFADRGVKVGDTMTLSVATA